MNRTISVNIGGYNFIMDEVAYEKLSAYLERYRRSMRQDECVEVMSDIEARIAEIFGGVHCQVVISEARVDEVIATIGEPEMMNGDEQSTTEETADNVVIGKKLYRDTDDCVIGGVCSGLAGYFNISAILVRLLFLLGFFLWGTTFVVYVVLWLIVPQAHGVKERLAMKGGFDAQTGARADGRRPVGDNVESDRGGCLGCLLRGVVIFIAVLAGLPMLVALLSSVVALLGVLVGVLAAIVTGGAVFSIGSICGLAGFGISGVLVLSVVGVVFLPVVFVLYLLVRVLFRLKWRVLPVFIVLLLLWLASVVCILGNVFDIAPKFSHRSTKTVVCDTLTLSSDRLVIMPMDKRGENRSDNDWVMETSEGDYDVSYNVLNRVFDIDMKPDVDLKRSKLEGDKVTVRVRVSSSGETNEAAERNINAMEYDYKFENDTLYLSQYIDFGEGMEWRAQSLDLDIDVPKNIDVAVEFSDVDYDD